MWLCEDVVMNACRVTCGVPAGFVCCLRLFREVITIFNKVYAVSDGA